MRITGMTAWLLEIDARLRYGDEGVPPGRPSTWYYPLFAIHTDAGIDGYTMGYGNQGDGRALVQLVRDVFMSEIIGENALHTEKLWQKLRRLSRHLYALSDGVIGMLDVAFWDIRGKAANQPIASLLGIYRDKVPGYATGYGFHPSPQQVADEAVRMKDVGFHGYKLHFWNTPEVDIPCMYAAREAVGSDYRLMQDLSGTYSYVEALAVGRVLDELNFHWFEEPIPDRQTSNLRRLADQINTPILGGETLRLDELTEQVRVGAFDIARGDVYMKAGITGLSKAFAMCELFGLNLEIHTMATPLLDLANLHVACSVKNGEFAEVIHPVYRFGLVGQPLDIDAEGYLHLPTGAGLGAELDWAWIDHNTVEVVKAGEGAGS